MPDKHVVICLDQEVVFLPQVWPQAPSVDRVLSYVRRSVAHCCVAGQRRRTSPLNQLASSNIRNK